MMKWPRFIQLELWGAWLRWQIYWQQKFHFGPSLSLLWAVRRWESQVRRWKERWGK